MARTPSGTKFAVATVFGSSKTTTVVTNATEAVVTSVAHGYANGDVVEILSGWAGLNKRAFRIKGVTADTFVLEKANTSNTTVYSTGSGLGSVRKVTTWVDIAQVLKPSTSGGEAKKVTFKYLESDIENSINNGFSAVDRSFELDADAIGTPGYDALLALTEVRSDTIFRSLAKSGAVTYLPSTVALNEEEQMTDDQIVTVKVSLAGNNKSTRYAA